MIEQWQLHVMIFYSKKKKKGHYCNIKIILVNTMMHMKGVFLLLSWFCVLVVSSRLLQTITLAVPSVGCKDYHLPGCCFRFLHMLFIWGAIYREKSDWIKSGGQNVLSIKHFKNPPESSTHDTQTATDSPLADVLACLWPPLAPNPWRNRWFLLCLEPQRTLCCNKWQTG